MARKTISCNATVSQDALTDGRKAVEQSRDLPEFDNVEKEVTEG